MEQGRARQGRTLVQLETIAKNGRLASAPSIMLTGTALPRSADEDGG